VVLRPGGTGEIQLKVRLESQAREVVCTLPGRYDVSPEQIGALEEVRGVMGVQTQS